MYSSGQNNIYYVSWRNRTGYAQMHVSCTHYMFQCNRNTFSYNVYTKTNGIIRCNALQSGSAINGKIAAFIGLCSIIISAGYIMYFFYKVFCSVLLDQWKKIKRSISAGSKHFICVMSYNNLFWCLSDEYYTNLSICFEYNFRCITGLKIKPESYKCLK